MNYQNIKDVQSLLHIDSLGIDMVGFDYKKQSFQIFDVFLGCPDMDA